MQALLVEDDTASAKSIEMMLKTEGYVCESTDHGEDGLEIGKLYDYDLIILGLIWMALKSCTDCAWQTFRHQS